MANIPLGIRTLVLMLLVGAGFLFRDTSREVMIPDTSYVHPNLFFDEGSFSGALKAAEQSSLTYPRPLTGGVVPHHLVPGHIIAELFKNAAKEKPELLFVIGPNHFERGKAPVLSSVAPWSTNFGNVEVDVPVLQHLVGRGLVSLDDKTLSLEHSMGNILPFVKYYLPETKIVPLILSKDLTEAEVRRLARAMSEDLHSRAMVVASVDFSHYQIRADAERNDEETERLMRERAIPELLSLSSDYIDSPPSIALLLLLMESQGIASFDLMHHTNSGVLLGREDSEITSYFSWVF